MCWPPAPRGAEGVGAHVGRVDVDLDRVVDLGVDEHAGEAGVAAARRVERALAHQAVHAGLGAQQAEGVVALDLDRRAADAGDVALGLFHHLGLEALALAVLQVLAQQHLRPVAGLGAAGAGLDVDEAVARVGRVVEHAAELELLDGRLELGGVGLDRAQAVEVAVGLRTSRTARCCRRGSLLRWSIVSTTVVERLLLAARAPGPASARSRRSGSRARR